MLQEPDAMRVQGRRRHYFTLGSWPNPETADLLGRITLLVARPPSLPDKPLGLRG